MIRTQKTRLVVAQNDRKRIPQTQRQLCAHHLRGHCPPPGLESRLHNMLNRHAQPLP